MRTTKQFSITLPHEMAEMVRTKVESGEYASESEVIRDGLRALEMHDRALEAWLREDVAVAYDAMKIDPSRARSAAQVRASLAAAHKSALKAEQCRTAQPPMNESPANLRCYPACAIDNPPTEGICERSL
jgi:putative addiction module CopG family antidote